MTARSLRFSLFGSVAGAECGPGRPSRLAGVRSLHVFVIPVFFLIPVCFASSGAGADTIDDFSSVAAWRPAPADGVEMTLSGEDGALRLDFDFHGRGGYAIARRAVDLALPANYAITFRLRGDAPVNTLEFKLVDSSGENVWWVRRPDVSFPHDWTTVRYKKRHVTFAWGPRGGGELERIAALEIAVTAGKGGGRGTIWLEDLQLVPLPPDRPYSGTPKLSRRRGTATVDFGMTREFGGLVVDGAPASYAVELSDDGKAWSPATTVRDSNGGRDFVYLPESEARHVRVRDLTGRLAPTAVMAQPLAFGASKNAFFAAIAKDAAPGRYPRYFRPEQVYWTVVGVDGDTEEALIDTDGAIEPFAGRFRLEPFLKDGPRLLGWNESEGTTAALAEGDLPVPMVTRRHGDLSLEIEALATGTPGASALYVRYRVTNRGAQPKQLALYLALRPLQVNPPTQFLGTPGGVAPLASIALEGTKIARLDGRRVVLLTDPSGFGAAPFAGGDVVDAIDRGTLPAATNVEDPFGHASAAFSFALTIPTGEARDVVVAVPLHDGGIGLAGSPSVAYAAQRDRALADWHGKLDRVSFRLPQEAQRLVRTLRSNVAYVLINRDGPGIQPGSRAYARSWIRDGALTTSALIRTGLFEPAREFIEWFATFQYPDGKIPCCADTRGADPVPENDSHGEFIYAVAEYRRLTGDDAFARQMWPHVLKAAEYIDALRQQRRTPEYERGDKRAFYGLLPQSISHEGYSAKPMHSFWDDFFGIVGLEDAAELAAALGETEQAVRLGRWRDEFRRDVHAAIRATITAHGIAHLPGCVELGDFDATSTTIALSPGRELPSLPRAELRATFDRFYTEVAKRRAGTWKVYTPYELRGIGALVRLGRADRAHELLDDYFRDQRPPGWNHWCEAVHNPPGKPAFVGDMPHTWVGSDFIRSFLDFFEYEEGGALKVGCGIPDAWTKAPGGVSVSGIRTRYGALELAFDDTPAGLHVRLGGIRVPPDGVIVCGRGKETVVRDVPSEVLIP